MQLASPRPIAAKPTKAGPLRDHGDGEQDTRRGDDAAADHNPLRAEAADGGAVEQAADGERELEGGEGVGGRRGLGADDVGEIAGC